MAEQEDGVNAMQEKVYPLCFAPRIYDLWDKADTAIPKGQRCMNPCVDCLPQYQMRMKKAGRCAHPETMFGVDKDGGIYGFWPEAA